MGHYKPCKGCEDRHLGCHDHCPRYDKMKAENAAEVAERRKDDVVAEYMGEQNVHNPVIKKWKADKRKGRAV